MRAKEQMTQINRRELLKSAAGASLAVGGVGALIGCGSESTGGAASTGNPQRGGRLRVGLTGGASSDTFDPHVATTLPDYARANCVFEGLMGANAAGRPTRLLAEEFSPNSTATEWTIRVREGVEFHNGKELTADDVTYTFRRIVDPKEPQFGASSLASIDAANIRKLDKYTIRVPMKRPFAVLDQVLSGSLVPGSAFFSIVPRGFDPKNPVGTGPFKYVSFTPNKQTLVKRNENYWKSGLPYLDEVQITEYSEETSQANALIADQEDAINSVAIGALGQLESAGLEALISESGLWLPLCMRVDLEPYSDPRVREAIKLVIDRQQMLDQVFGGHGTVGNDIMCIFDPEYDHSIPQREQDVEKAQFLLKQAGRSSAEFELVAAPIGQGAVQLSEVFAQQAQSAGMNVTLRKTTLTNFFGHFLQWPFSATLWLGEPYLVIVGLSNVAGAPFNETHFEDAKYSRLYNEAISTLDTGKRKQISHEMQRIEYDIGGFAGPVFAPIFDGHNPRVQGLTPTRSGLSLHDYVFTSVWLS